MSPFIRGTIRALVLLRGESWHVVAMKIRKAKKSDSSSLAALSIEVWVGTYLKRGVNAVFAEFALTEFTPEKMAARIADAARFVLVSENDEGVDGFIEVSRRRQAPVSGGPKTELSTFYVQPRHHGKGIGTGLLNAAFQHCREDGIHAIWLATNAGNDPAIAFYLGHGFEKIGETQFMIGQDGYLNNVYAKDLS